MNEHRTALVTGGNRGIGFEICRQLARNGMHVLLGARDRAAGDQAAQALASEGMSVEALELDVSDPRQCADVARQVAARTQRCDVLVNNAGVMLDARGSGVLDATAEMFRQTFETNVYGPLRLMQALAPLMRSQRYGRVVNVSSGLGQLHDMNDGTPAYRMSKTALNALTRMFAAALREDNILVNAMCPGWVRTRMGGSNAPRTPQQAADTALWLATLPDDGPSGSFFRDRQPIPW